MIEESKATPKLMKAIPKDYEPPEQDFTSFPDGKYKVNSFEWFTLNDEKQPILKAQKDMKMVGRLRFNLSDGNSGPPFSLTLGEMAMLVLAFGKDTKNLPALPAMTQPGKITEYMQKIEEVCTGKEIEVEVKNGWVQSVKGMDVPDDYFYFQLSDMSPKDDNGNPYYKEGQYGHFFFVEFEVHFGEGGSETPYKGAKFTEIVSYAVEVNNNEPDWQKTKVEKVYSASGVRLSNLVRITAPSMNLEQGFKFQNPHNILPEWWKHAQNDKVMLKGNRARNDSNGRIQLLWSSLKPVSVSDSVQTKEELNLTESDIKAREVLAQLLDHLANGGGPTVENNNLTRKGKELARNFIVPVKKEGKIQHGSFSELTFDEVLAIFNYAQEKNQADGVIKELKEKLIFAGVGFDKPEVIQDEWGDETPF